MGRNLRHLVLLLEDLQAIGVGFVSLNEGIDLGTPAGRLQLHILPALSEFERCRIQERVRAGLARAKAQGKRLGRPRRRVRDEQLEAVQALSIREVRYSTCGYAACPTPPIAGISVGMARCHSGTTPVGDATHCCPRAVRRDKAQGFRRRRRSTYWKPFAPCHRALA